MEVVFWTEVGAEERPVQKLVTRRKKDDDASPFRQANNVWQHALEFHGGRRGPRAP